MRKLVWVGSSKKDLTAFPDETVDMIGFDLYAVQKGEMPEKAKPLQGFGGAGVQEIVARTDGNAYRAVYTVALKHAVYVLHCFQKKSVQGIKTPQPDVDLIKERLQRAKELDVEKDNEKAS